MSEENTKNDSTEQENERQYESIDQALSMHSSLRDRYRGRAFWLNTVQIGISLFLCVFAFVGDDVLRLLGYDPSMVRTIIGFAAVIVLLLAITEFRVNWTEIGARHAEAARCLGELKAKYRMAFNESAGNDAIENSRLTVEYQKTMAILPPIPERDFIQLKADHQFKRIMSQRLSHNPKAPQWFLRIQLRCEGICAALKKDENRADEGRKIRND